MAADPRPNGRTPRCPSHADTAATPPDRPGGAGARRRRPARRPARRGRRPGRLAVPGLRTSMAEPQQAEAVKPAPDRRRPGLRLPQADLRHRPAGPPGRPPTPGQRQMVAEHFEKLGGAVREQPFDGTDPISHAAVPDGQPGRVVVPRPGRPGPARRPLRLPPLPRRGPRPRQPQEALHRRQRRRLGRRPADGDRPPPQRLAHPLGRRPRPLRRRGAVLRRRPRTTSGEFFLGSKALRHSLRRRPPRRTRASTRPRSSSTWSATRT